MGLEKQDIQHTKKKNLVTDLTAFKKLTLHDCNLNVKCKTVKFLEHNIGENLDDRGFGGKDLDKTSKFQSMRELISRTFLKVKISAQ